MRYHKEVYLPPIPAVTLKLEYSTHAIQAAKFDERANLLPYLPKSIETNLVEIVELDTFVNENGREVIEKLLVRFAIDEKLDLCLVVLAKPRNKWLVKTLWSNDGFDTHKTLRNRQDFEKGPRKA